MAMTLGPINPETQGKNPLGLGVWVLIFQSGNTLVLDTGKRMTGESCSSNGSCARLSPPSQESCRRYCLWSWDKSRYIYWAQLIPRILPALWEELLIPPEKKKRCTEENTQGTRKWQLKGTQEAKPLSLICSKPICGMAWLWHSIFKRRESWDRMEIQIVIIQSRFENFLAMELFLQMKSPGAPIFRDSRSLSCLRALVLRSQFPLEDSSRQHREAGAPEWWAHSWGRRTLTCYHRANPKIRGTSAE